MLWKNKNVYVFRQRIGGVEEIITATKCFAANVCAANSNIIKLMLPGMRWLNGDHPIKVNSNGASNNNGD